ncbi:MAG: response regulator, partial [Pseudomonadales bacterium]|nr:response regulator [Pseudomonadales bacterium]
MSAVSKETSNQSSIKILIVDDEMNILRSLRRLLRHTGYTLIFTNVGQEALDILNTEDIAVLLCDQNLPDIGGDKIIKESFARNSDTVRLIMTGATNFEFLENAINEGKIEHFIQKPWDKTKLLDTIYSSVAQYQKKKQQ